MAKYDLKYTTGSAPTGTTKYDNLAFATGTPDYTQSGWTGGVDDTIYSGGSFQFNTGGAYSNIIEGVYDVSSAGNFTVELWIYPTSTSYRNFFIIGNAEPYQTRFFMDNGVLGFHRYPVENVYVPDTILTSAGAITQNTWQHVAIVRNGTTITAYINGVAGATPATGISGAIGNVHGWSLQVDGYLTNFRWNNTTAVYTGAFTPSTIPLTPTQKSGVNISSVSSGTKILLLASSSNELISHPIDGNFISDSSGNNATIRNSWIIPINNYVDPRVTYSSLSPFTSSTPRYLFIGNSTDLSLSGRSAGAGSTTIETNRPIHWATNNKSDAEVLRVINRLPQRPQDYTDAAAALAWVRSSSYYVVYPLGTAGSLLFNGSNQSLSLSPGIIFGAGAYTVEGWFYNTSNFNNKGILGSPVTSPTGCMNLHFSSSTLIQSDKNGGGGAFAFTMASAISLNAWHYFIYNRNANGLVAVYIDGVRSTATYTDTLNYNTATDTIGRDYAGYWPGYWTNMRITIGTAVYDSSVSTQTNPSVALTSLANTKYLMLGASATTDTSGIQTVTNNNTVTTTQTIPF